MGISFKHDEQTPCVALVELVSFIIVVVDQREREKNLNFIDDQDGSPASVLRLLLSL